MTKIEWTEKTWNPIAGCSVVSPGCTNCYAMKQAPRLAANPATPQYAGTVQNSKGGPVWTGKIGIASDRVLTQPLRRKKPTMYFVNSMSDLFHEGVADDVIDRIFAVMARCPQHTFQVLTKRADRMREYMAAFKPWRDPRGRVRVRTGPWMTEEAQGPTRPCYVTRGGVAPSERPKGSPLFHLKNSTWPLSNVWLGVSIEDQTRADERIPLLLDTPAAVRFISAEPLLGAVDLCLTTNRGDLSALIGIGVNADVPDAADGYYRTGKLDWVIVGGESGNKARPMHPDWARSLRDQCVAAGVPFFFKQWGSWVAKIDRDNDDPDWRGNYGKAYKAGYVILNLEGGTGFHGDRVHLMKRTTKVKVGRLLDGRVWDEMPERVQEDRGHNVSTSR